MRDDRRNSCCHSEAGQKQARENLGPHPVMLRRKETTTNEEGTITADGRSETHAVLLFGSDASLHYDLFSLAQSAHMCRLHLSFFSAEGISWQWTFRTLRPHSSSESHEYHEHFLVISHWTSYATKSEPACLKNTHPSTTSRTSQAGLEMT